MPLSSRISLRQPVSLEPVEHLLRALVLPGDDGRQRRGRSRRPRRAPTRPGGRGRRRRPLRARRAAASATASTTARQHVLRILLHPARPRMVERLLAPRLAQRAQVGVEEDRLHGRGALVDAEQQGHRARVLRGPAPPRHARQAAVRPAPSGRSGPSATPSRSTRPQTYSAIPSDAVRPVERIAATLTRPRTPARARSGS